MNQFLVGTGPWSPMGEDKTLISCKVADPNVQKSPEKQLSMSPTLSMYSTD